MSLGRRDLLLGLSGLPWLGCGHAGTESRPPRTPDTVDVRLPPLTFGTLDNGASLYLMEDHGLPLVAMAVAVAAGHRYERPGEEGRAAVAAALLLEGMEGGSRATLLDRYGELGTTPSASVGVTHVVLRCVVHRDDAPAALQLMLANLRSATMAEEAFVRVVQERRELLLAARGIPEVVAGFGLVRGSLGVDPPVAMFADGTPKSLAALTPAEARSWIPDRLGLDALTFGFAGDVKAEQVPRWVGDATTEWSSAPHPAKDAPTAAVTESEHPRIVLVPWPRLPQAVVAMGGPRQPYGHEDEPAQTLASGMMGGIMHHELRTRQRVSYGVQTRSWSTKRGPVAQLWAKVEPADMGTAVKELWSYFERLQRDVQLSEEAVLDVRQAAMVRLMHEHHGAESGLSQLLELAEGGLSAHTTQRRLESLQRLRAYQVTAALRYLYHPDRVRLCVVGNPMAIEHARKALPDADTVERTPAQLFGLDVGDGGEDKPSA